MSSIGDVLPHILLYDGLYSNFQKNRKAKQSSCVMFMPIVGMNLANKDYEISHTNTSRDQHI